MRKVFLSWVAFFVFGRLLDRYARGEHHTVKETVLRKSQLLGRGVGSVLGGFFRGLRDGIREDEDGGI